MLEFLVLLAGSIVAQTPEHTAIKGSVADSLGARIGKAEIRVLDSITHAIVARAVTDQLGTFEVEVSPGNYVITVRVVGFRLGISPEVAVREGETASLGELRLDVPRCDAPGIFCDTFYQTPAEPRVTEPIKQAGVDLKLNCGLDILTGATSCPPSSDADFTLESDRRSLYVEPLRGAAIWNPGFPFDGCNNQGRSDAQIRIDGFGGGLRYGLDFCVLRRDHLVSHVYLNRDVAADSKEAHFFFTTTRR